MKKLFLSTLLLALPLLASAYDIAVKNADGVTIYYNYYNNGTELEVARSDYSGVINIPEDVTYMSRTRKVTSIENHAFYYCRSLSSVTIPNSVTSIKSGTFYFCTRLSSVTIGNSVTSIGDDAFFRCDGLTSVYITDLAAWCNIEFSDNPLGHAHHLYLNGEEINDLVIPNSVTSIGKSAFAGCSSLTSVTIPNSVTNIGESAFAGCIGLTSVHITDIAAWCRIAFNESVSNPLYYAHHLYLNGEEIKDLVIPNSVTSIGNNAFWNCTGLTSVTIPNSVTNIGESAFAGCIGLTSITIPYSVTSIESYAFDGCTGLTSVISKTENPCYIDWNCFPNDVFYNVTLYVPKGTTEKYKSTDYWSRFVFIEEGEPGSSTQPEEKKCATPTISYANKKLTFTCDTEGANCQYTITDSDINSGAANEVSLSATYEISVYATKSGFVNSDVATATLVWTEAVFTETTPSTPSSAKAIRESIPVLISAQNGTITVRGEQNGLPVTVYSADGKMLGSATIMDGQASIATNLQRGEIVIVKVGKRSVKIKATL